MLNEIITRKEEKTAIGLMSGTSQDGIDTALLTINGYGKATKIKLIGFDTYEYPSELKEKLHEITTKEGISIKDVARLNYAIGKNFAYSAKKICYQSGKNIEEVDFIGSHGQTIIHLPEETDFCGEQIKATMQIGEPSIIAKETGVLTVADFRPCDIALGGEGAPLTAYTDYLIFSSKYKNRAVMNIGGITNISILEKNCLIDEINGYDIGPGNMCINEAMKILYDKEYDKNGEIAKIGEVKEKLLENMLSNPFFKSNLKSTGRVHFGANFVKENILYAREKGVTDEDIIATFTELSAYHISKNINKLNLDEIIVCGGGYNNPVMMNSIMDKNPDILFKDIQKFGMTVDNREAISFAILANETLEGKPSNLGNKRGILGKIVLP